MNAITNGFNLVTLCHGVCFLPELIPHLYFVVIAASKSWLRSLLGRRLWVMDSW
jgi:hypothetical protein